MRTKDGRLKIESLGAKLHKFRFENRQKGEIGEPRNEKGKN